jgi:membrane fusion protein, heavy metal efflux system
MSMLRPPIPLSNLLAALLCCACGAALAHEGHHEAESEAAAPIVTPAPRAALDTPQLELVVQREGADLVLYLDDYDTNAPLNGLQVSVRSGTLTVQAAASGEGAYRIAGDLVDGHDGQLLDIAVHGPGIDARLQAPLPAAMAPDHVAHAEPARRDQVWIFVAAAAALLVLVIGWFLWRRRDARAARGLGTA